MNAAGQGLTRRAALQGGGALVVGFAWAPAASSAADAPVAAGGPPWPQPSTRDVDSFLVLQADGRVQVRSGKVDLGTGHRIAMRQMVGEELELPVERIDLVEGDSALTPNQGPTAGSTGVMRGGVELRQAAATARQALLGLAAQRWQLPAGQLRLDDGAVLAPDGRRLAWAALLDGGRFTLALDPRAPLKSPSQYRWVGRPLPRPDVPDKVCGRHRYVHDLVLPGLLHGRVVRPPAVGARLLAVDESSVQALPGVRVVRRADFVGVVGPDEWAVLRAARELRLQWSDSAPLIGHAALEDWALRGPYVAEEVVERRGDAAALQALADDGQALRARYVWPIQSHGSIGPSCAVADVRADQGTVWTASQASHRFQAVAAALTGLPRERLRVIYLDGAGCYGMNGHDDAAAEAVMLSQAVGAPVRVQWSREDELGWDPKGPPQLLDLAGRLGDDGRIAAWRTEMAVPRATANLEWIPLLSPLAAGLPQPVGQAVGLVSQNGAPPYAPRAVQVRARWLGPAPLRPSNIRAPGKVANCFAVESFVDELAAAAGQDPLAFRLRDLADPRGAEVLRRAARLIGWQARPSPAPAAAAAGVSRGRGLAYLHYKGSETHVAVAIEVEVDRRRGTLAVRRIACAHDCGLMINPDTVRAQVEGNLLQTLSRTLYEQTTFDRSRVTSVDWATYRLLRFPEVPAIEIDLVQRLDQPPVGAGEAASCPVPAALANAVFDATGLRLRRVPLAEALREALRT